MILQMSGVLERNVSFCLLSPKSLLFKQVLKVQEKHSLFQTCSSSPPSSKEYCGLVFGRHEHLVLGSTTVEDRFNFGRPIYRLPGSYDHQPQSIMIFHLDFTVSINRSGT